MARARLLLVLALATLVVAGCRGARLTAPGTDPSPPVLASDGRELVASAPRLVPRRGELAPAQPTRGPLTARYSDRERRSEADPGVTDSQLGDVTKTLERRRPDTWKVKRPGRTAVDRAHAEAERWSTPNGGNPARGFDPNGPITVDVKRFVDFMAALFGR